MLATTRIVQFLLAALIVVLLGGLAGWYFFVQKQIDTTERNDDARSFGSAPSFGERLGSTYQNLVEGLAGGFGQVGTETGEGRPAPKLWRVSAAPVAGMGFMASSSLLYFAERATGNVLRADPLTTTISRLTNTLLPKVHEAVFAENGSVILRSLSENGSITTFAAELATTTASLDAAATPLALDGVYLPENIIALSAERGGKRVMYLVESPAGGVVGATATWTGKEQKRIFDSTLSGWRLVSTEGGSAALVQKASDDVAGYAFLLQPSGTLTPLVGNLPGLNVLPRTSGGAFLYSVSSGGALSLFVQTSPSATPVRLPIRTLTDKCVWARGSELLAYCAVPQSTPGSDFLRDWYRGIIHTTDALWAIHASSGTAEILFTPPSDTTLDIRELKVDDSGSYVTFVNGADRSLWLLRITE